MPNVNIDFKHQSIYDEQNCQDKSEDIKIKSPKQNRQVILIKSTDINNIIFLLYRIMQNICRTPYYLIADFCRLILSSNNVFLVTEKKKNTVFYVPTARFDKGFCCCFIFLLKSISISIECRDIWVSETI